MSKKIVLREKLSAKNEAVAAELGVAFRQLGLFVVDLIGSPGAGKTRLLEAMAPRLRGHAAVIEGDIQTDRDTRRIEKAGLPACQINTQGACHLDAAMVRDAAATLTLDGLRYLFIENVGNLVCPAGFALGEHMKVAVVSVTEGDDKPAKYPAAIRRSAAMVLTKTDLLPHVDCDVARMEREAKEINPELAVFQVSAGTGAGIGPWMDWLDAMAARS